MTAPTPAQTTAAIDRIQTAKDKIGAAIKEGAASGRIDAAVADRLNMDANDPAAVEAILGELPEDAAEPNKAAYDKVKVANEEHKVALEEGLESGHVTQEMIDRVYGPPEPPPEVEIPPPEADPLEVKWKEDKPPAQESRR